MLDERSKQVLMAVVQSYIQSPEPVGSRFVTKKYSIGFSPATIRNIMSDLEELGFLAQPHTSAGRIPTDKGYRLYVDFLLALRGGNDTNEISQEFMNQFSRKLEHIKSDMATMFSEVTNTLSTMSNYIGLALPPKPERTTFNRIELLRYREGQVVAVLLTDEGIIKSKILEGEVPLTQADLNRIADYLNEAYSGYTLDEIKSILIKRIKYEKALWDKLVANAIAVCEQILSFSESDLYMSGLYEMINLPDFTDISKIKEMAGAIKEKHLILKLLNELANAEGVQVLIGDENPVGELKRLSVVTSTYKEGERNMGVIALVGPTRMNYAKAITMVDTVAKCISQTLEKG